MHLSAQRVLPRTMVVLWAGTLGCGSSISAPSPAGESPSETLRSTHFVLHYSSLDAATVQQTSTRLEAEFDRIVSDLRVSSMPVVNVYFYGSHDALVAGAGRSAGVIPSWATGLATAVDQVHMMSPAVAGPYDRALSNLVHEFAHCVSIRVRPTIPNNPRWLWESVAIYESQQSVDPRTLGYLLTGQPPAFTRLNSLDNTLVYEVGYLIAEFIVERWGRDRLVALIAANGDTLGVLGVTLADFESEWFGAVRSKYGL